MSRGAVALAAFLALGVAPAAAGASGYSTSKGANFIQDVSCPSEQFCLEVGTVVTGLVTTQPLVEQFDGTTWSAVSTPSIATPAIDNELNSVSCTAWNFCIAVGSTSRSVVEPLPLAEIWNGSTLTTLSVPLGADTNATLNSVSCSSSSDCVAVGDALQSWGDLAAIPLTPIAETWDGSTWGNPVPLPAPTDSPWLSGVSCVSTTFCAAVGNDQDGAAILDTFNGSAWQAGSLSGLSSGDVAQFDSVSCPAATFCAATGVRVDGVTGVPDALATTWDGSSWTVQTTDSPGVTYNELDGVSCPTPTDCVAVGVNGSIGSSTPFEPIVEDSSGGAFSSVSTPDLTGTNDLLFAVSCPDVTWCESAGYYLGSLLTPGLRHTESSVVPRTSDSSQMGYDVADRDGVWMGGQRLGRVPNATSTIRLTSSVSSLTVGHKVTLTASVKPASANGTVAIVDGSTSTSVCPRLSIKRGRVTCKVSWSTSGSHALRAIYLGSSSRRGSTSSVLTLNVH